MPCARRAARSRAAAASDAQPAPPRRPARPAARSFACCGCLRPLWRRDAPSEPPLAHAGAPGGVGWPYPGSAHGAGGVGALRDTPSLSPPPQPHLVTPPTPAKTEVEEGSLAAALLDAARAAPRAHAYAAGGSTPQPRAQRTPRDLQRTV